ncbi:anti-sigma factor family protein [Duganella levis]|uniref:Anti-sigma factor n=1 Tax=Duganella levis TaxID=2692169 RepID=A0ABW9W8B8_9BURK|nr:anti-sigma factor [Duganella levis]MYN30248.1 anti-sigma factor [Duganella levis]
MDCKLSREELSAYLDAELDGAELQQVQAHLDQCASCRAALAQLEVLQDQLQVDATHYAAPAYLRHRIHAALHDNRPPLPAARPRRWSWAWINLGLAAGATTAFAVTLSLYLAQPSQDDLAERELVASHFRALMPEHLADVASTDQHTVKPWFAGKLDYSPPVHDLATQGYPLIGGRLDYLQQRPVAALAYRHRLHIINLYVWPQTAQHDGTPHAAAHQGFHLLRWTQDGMQYAAVSDIAAPDLQDFSRRLQAAQAQSAQ